MRKKNREMDRENRTGTQRKRNMYKRIKRPEDRERKKTKHSKYQAGTKRKSI